MSWTCLHKASLWSTRVNSHMQDSAIIFAFFPIFRFMATPLLFLWIDMSSCQMGLWGQPDQILCICRERDVPSCCPVRHIKQETAFSEISYHDWGGGGVVFWVGRRHHFSSYVNLKSCPLLWWRAIPSHKRNQAPCSAWKAGCTVHHLLRTCESQPLGTKQTSWHKYL